MSSIPDIHFEEKLAGSNITTRRLTDINKKKMTTPFCHVWPNDQEADLLVGSILTKDEEMDVMTMLDLADELDGLNPLPGFITSTQMGKREPRNTTTSPPLSPVPFPDGGSSRNTMTGLEPSSGVSTKPVRQLDLDNLLQANLIDEKSCIAHVGKKHDSFGGSTDGASGDVEVSDLERPEFNDRNRREGADQLTDKLRDVKTITTAIGSNEMATRNDDDNDNREADNPRDESDTDNEAGSTDGADGYDKSAREDKSSKYLDPAVAAVRLARVDELLELLNDDSVKLASTVRHLEHSLDFSHKEIADLKKENADLKLKLGNIETEDRRTQFQIKDVADKLDKLDSVSKKRNLLFDGIPEIDGRREESGKVISNLFDQLNINKGINFEACYRIGPHNKSRPRSILVSFERQADRDLVYSKRMDLKHTENYQKVWINEDVSPASRRRRDIIRLITKEAHEQGIDCKSGKYAMHINNVKYDESNLDDLPRPLHPSNLKQVQIDKDTLAYQSEFAPFSNFYDCQVIIGKHRFFCAEQALQFLKAKTLNKPLAATRIYLSRDVRYIKQVGNDLGTSDEWEARKYDYMYICLKKKFDQNPALKALLMSTGNMELVEATPDRLWGCGATLSSNTLKRHTWPGQNKHGAILMTIREEFRQTKPKTI